MGHIAVNFDEVPDKFEILPPGEYVMRIDSAKVEPTKDQKGQKVVVEMTVDSGGAQDGRKVFDHLSLKTPIGLKQLMKSCGLVPGAGGFDPDELVGKHAKVLVKTRAYADAAAGGMMKETASVDRYLFEAA